MNLTKASCATLVCLALAAAAPARAGDREFHEVVSRLAAAYHQQPMRFMGLISLAARFAQPEGVSGLKLAIFDGIDPSLSPEGAQFDRFIEDAAGGYHPFVRVRSRRSAEQTHIYLRERGGRTEMLLVTVDSSDAVVMKMWLKPEALAKWVDDPVGEGRHSCHRGLHLSATAD